MIEKERDTKLALSEEDEPVEWTDEMFDRAQISVGGVVIREATGTLTKRGRPPLGEAPKQQVTLRLPRHVLDHFKAGGAGWQSRLSEALERHVTSSRVAEARAAYEAAESKQEVAAAKRKRKP